MPALQNLDVEWVSLVDRAAVRDPEDPTQPERFLVWKRETNKGGGAMTLTPEEMAAALKKAEQERDQAKADLEKATTDAAEQKTALDKATADIAELQAKVGKDDVEKDDEEIKKEDLPEPVRKALEKAEADRKASDERAEKAEKAATEAGDIAKAERNERLKATFIAKADAYKALPVKKDEFGPVLQAASEKLSKEEFEALDTVLKAADEQIAESDLFKEQGRTHGAAETGALAEAKQKAEELKKADPKLSDAEALKKAMDSDPALQERYLAEQRA
jgi:hypothetical protein